MADGDADESARGFAKKALLWGASTALTAGIGLLSYGVIAKKDDGVVLPMLAAGAGSAFLVSAAYLGVIGGILWRPWGPTRAPEQPTKQKVQWIIERTDCEQRVSFIESFKERMTRMEALRLEAGIKAAGSAQQKSLLADAAKLRTALQQDTPTLRERLSDINMSLGSWNVDAGFWQIEGTLNEAIGFHRARLNETKATETMVRLFREHANE